MISYKEVNTPTWLTIIRLVVSPLVLPLLFVTFLPFNSISLNCSLAVAFALLGATDFFDGYLARKYSQETLFGKVLDPIADKFLVYSTLIALLAIGKIYYYWVVVLIGREFFVMGLRLIALEYGMNVSVSWGGKIKTAVQMALLIFLIINPYQSLGFAGKGVWWNGCELALLIVSLVLAVVSAYWYYSSLIARIHSTNNNE